MLETLTKTTKKTGSHMVIRSDSYNSRLIKKSVPEIVSKAEQVAWENRLNVSCPRSFINTVQCETTDIVVAAAADKPKLTKDEVLDAIGKLVYIYAVVFENGAPFFKDPSQF